MYKARKKEAIAALFMVIMFIGIILFISSISKHNTIKNVEENGKVTEGTLHEKIKKRSTRRIGGRIRLKSRYSVIVTFFDNDKPENQKVDFLNYQPGSYDFSFGELYRHEINKWLAIDEYKAVNEKDRVEIIYLKENPEEFVVLKSSFDRVKAQNPYILVISGILIIISGVGFWKNYKEYKKIKREYRNNKI